MNKELIVFWKKHHEKLLRSGMFWEIFPELTGNWEEDKEEFIEYNNKLIALKSRQLS